MSTEAPDRLEWDVRSPTVLPFGMPLDRRRQLFSDWVSNTFTGPVLSPLVVLLSLEDQVIEVGDLNELIVGIGRDLRSRRFGPLFVVVTTRDPAMQDVVRSVASRHEVPIYLAPSPLELDMAEPALDVTPAQRLVLEAVREFGRATASEVAESVGGRSTSTGNLLAGLSSAGLLYRSTGSGRVGHAYVHPRLIESTKSPQSHRSTVDIPRGLSREVADAAAKAGVSPAAMLEEAWREFTKTGMARRRAAGLEALDRGEFVDAADLDSAIEATRKGRRSR